MAAVKCRNTRCCLPFSSLLGVAVLTSLTLSSGSAGASPTTSVPSSSQIAATQSQVSALEATISQQQQRTQALDEQYVSAQQTLQNTQRALQATSATIATTQAQIKVDKQRLATDAIDAYVFATPETRVTNLFTTSATKSDAQREYQNTVVGDISAASSSLTASEAKLNATLAQQQTQQQQAAASAAQAQSLAAQNAAATQAAQATLNQVKGTLAQQVAAAAAAQAQAAAAAAAAAKTAAAAKAAAAKAASAATVAQTVGDSTTAAAATASANKAAGAVAASQTTTSSSSGSGPHAYTPTVSSSAPVTAAGQAAVQAAESQQGVNYVFGGETPGVGFDCSGLTQWAWAQAGVSIPRTSEGQYAGLKAVPQGSPLEPGDILFYYNLDDDNAVDHVVMYIGNGQVISAPETGRQIYISSIFLNGLVGAGRP